MKKFHLILELLLAFLMLSCSSRVEESGSVSLTMPAIQTRAHSFDELTDYTVSVAGPQTVVKEKIKPGETVVFDQLLIGQYIITIKGFSKDAVIAEGSSTALVLAGTDTKVSIYLRLVNNQDDNVISPDDPDAGKDNEDTETETPEDENHEQIVPSEPDDEHHDIIVPSEPEDENQDPTVPSGPDGEENQDPTVPSEPGDENQDPTVPSEPEDENHDPIVPTEPNENADPAEGFYAKLVKTADNEVQEDPETHVLYVLTDRHDVDEHKGLFKVTLDGQQVDDFTVSIISGTWSSAGIISVLITYGENSMPLQVPVRTRIKPTAVTINTTTLGDYEYQMISISFQPLTLGIDIDGVTKNLSEITKAVLTYALYNQDGSEYASGSVESTGDPIIKLSKADLSNPPAGVYTLKIVATQELSDGTYRDYLVAEPFETISETITVE